MHISDILVVITIFIAIVAIISERNRTYLWLKFSEIERWVYAGGFILIHILIIFKWWMNRLPLFEKLYFPESDWPTPNAWAYMVFLAMLIWFIYKMQYAGFPWSNHQKVINNYTELLLKGEYGLLTELIEKYHRKDIIKYLRIVRDIKIPEETISLQRASEYRKIYNKKIILTKHKYAAIVYGRILTNEAYIQAIANINPILFAEIIQEINNTEVKNPDFVNYYLKQLMRNKNSWFFREVRNNQNLAQYDTYDLSENRPILFALFNNINVALVNEAWRGVAEEAILEMKEEANKPESPLRQPEVEPDDYQDTIWSYRIMIAIHFFDIMVRQAIANGIDNHMWMFYYRNFVEGILNNMDDLPHPDSDINERSRNYKMLEVIFMNLMAWKKVALQSNQNRLLYSIYSVTGDIIYRVSITNKLRIEDKRYLLDWLWMDLLRTWEEDRDEITTEIIENGFNAFITPRPMLSGLEGQVYKQVIIDMWNNRDTPVFNGIVGQRGTQFSTQVVTPFQQP